MVSLYVDGQKKLFPTTATTVGDVLSRSHVTLGQSDLVEPAAGTAMSGGQFNINVYRARPVVVVDGVHSYHIHSAYQSPRLLALAAGLTLYPEDNYHTEIITNIVQNDSIGEKVTVQRATPLDVQVDGGVRHLRTQASTVGDALKAAGISLGLKDTISTSLSTPVISGMTVNITRVTEAVVTLTQTLPRPVHTVTDPTMLKGQTAVQQEGSDGQKTTTYRIHYQNGVETSREVLQVVSQTAPVPQVVAVGTKVIFAGSVEYWRPKVEAAATQWGLDPNMMLRIMNCESHGNATEVSAFIVNGQHPTGLFQFLPSTWTANGGTADNILDGNVQIQIAAKIMAGPQGTTPWQCK
ncbi:MAG TPA: ubiquitin-like domain-containing protein [Candidatus Saccharimonadia bacterium]|jgi:uncharacterized protein YabE (DUF348 family)